MVSRKKDILSSSHWRIDEPFVPLVLSLNNNNMELKRIASNASSDDDDDWTRRRKGSILLSSLPSCCGAILHRCLLLRVVHWWWLLQNYSPLPFPLLDCDVCTRKDDWRRHKTRPDPLDPYRLMTDEPRPTRLAKRSIKSSFSS